MRLSQSYRGNMSFRKTINFLLASRFIALALILSLASLLAPVSVKAAMLQDAEQKLSAALLDFLGLFPAAVGSLRGRPDGERYRKGVRPSPAPTKEEREARVATLELNPNTDVTLQSRQPLAFAAIPLDQQGGQFTGCDPPGNQLTSR